jgi:N utilization substance protein B
MTRREAREAAISMLFAIGYTPDKDAETILGEYESDFDGKTDPYVKAAVEGVLSHLTELDAAIGEAAVGWTMSRISRISMAILRLACYELLYMPEIPVRVSINEAIELSKSYDEEKAYSFVNGVLNRIKESDAVKSLGHA